MKFISKIIILSLFVIPSSVLAHPGRTASDGCHYCRTNCSSWGVTENTRHCHQVKSVPQPSYPVTSTYGEGGTGTVRKAPEYTKPKIETKAVRAIEQKNNMELATSEDVTTASLLEDLEQEVKSVQRQNWVIRFIRFLF